MTLPRPPEPVTLVCGMLSARPALLDEAERRLGALFGPVDLRSPLIEFDVTDYYEPQMGRDLKRRLVSFEQTIDPADIAGIKLATNTLERELAALDRSVPRPVNLDPGYVCGSKLVLATAKDRSQRLYVGRGVYVEITLEFRGGTFRPTPTTYRDYASDAYVDFFLEVRRQHLAR